MNLEMECKNCRVSTFCPKKGASPLIENGRRYLCRIIGGFPAKEVSKEKISSKSLEICEQNGGKCLTIAEVPEKEDDIILYTLVKVFSPPVLMNRQATTYKVDILKQSSHR
jgi:hypothetical protein